ILGFSVALGAFLAGALVAESGAGRRGAPPARPLRDMFAALFLVSVASPVDPRVLWEGWGVVLAFWVLVVVGKIGAVFFSTLLTGNNAAFALAAAMSLTQIGEFSFIILEVGHVHGIVGPALLPVSVAVSVLTACTTPWLIRFSGPA